MKLECRRELSHGEAGSTKPFTVQSAFLDRLSEHSEESEADSLPKNPLSVSFSPIESSLHPVEECKISEIKVDENSGSDHHNQEDLPVVLAQAEVVARKVKS